MLKRCIMIFPKFGNGQILDEVREKYDPLAHHVKPHITLGFPFCSNIETNQLKEHLTEVLTEFHPFEIVMTGIRPVDSFGRYLFLNIEKGSEEIIEIHKKLYTGILEDYYPEWLKGKEFFPHMTVGALNSEEEHKKAAYETSKIKDVFKTRVTEISVEIIDENEDSNIELELQLQ